MLSDQSESTTIPTVTQLANLPVHNRWAYGITTVPERKYITLPTTIRSLRNAGFPNPHLFVDGFQSINPYTDHFNLPVSIRYPRSGIVSNWILSATELYTLYPHAQMYCIFQDDVLASTNLYQYLDSQSPLYARTYWNLYTDNRNVSGLTRKLTNPTYQPTDYNSILRGWYVAPEKCKGALGLAFSRETLLAILTSPILHNRPLHRRKHNSCVDGMVYDVLDSLGYKELIHIPSMLQHIGDESTITSNRNIRTASTFLGENFDCLSLLPQPQPNSQLQTIGNDHA